MDFSTKSDEELIQMWRHYEFILNECVSMGDIYAQLALEGELVRRGYDQNDKGEIVKVE